MHAGAVRRNAEGLLSDDPVVHALLAYVQADQEIPAEIASSDISSLELHAHPQLATAVDAFKRAFTVETADLVSHADASGRATEQIDADIHIAMLLKAIEQGARAFGPNASIEVEGRGSLPVDQFLASHAPTINSNDDLLGKFVNDKVRNDRDLLTRLGAQSLLHAATKKEFQLLGLAGSIGVSSGLGSAWELGVSQLLKNAMFGKGFSPSKYALQAAGIDSAPPALIETLDTLCVLSIIKGMKGEDWSLRDLLPKAMKAGAISSALSFPNNLLQYTGFKSRPADLAANTVTSEAAIFGAASGIPPELKESEELMRAGLFQSMKDGVIARPAGEASAKHTIEQMARHALDIAPGESTAVKSMGLAAIVGMMPLIASDKATGLASEQLLRIVRSAVFNPIEAIALNAIALGGRIKVPGLFDSDNAKHARVVQTILVRASQQMDAGNRTISAEELHRQLAPRSEFLRHMGAAIVKGMNLSMDAIPMLARKLGYGKAPLDARIPYQDLHAPAPVPQALP
ncbi:type III effector [Xanthomonas hyacinthi]|uniref:Type III effector n=1 Tax=Xanthomonas hyacinthi TaxID=56455 RepID=A0A2S7F247_9XANT|nr:type III effector [Xanthomonas hyacinthi]QGY78294.1 type III effector [Xanthomonas hyacinthi]